MATQEYQLIGRGVYTLQEAHRLTGLPKNRILRWSRGYWFQSQGKRRFSPAIIGTGTEDTDRLPILEFRDLIEIRFLNAFRRHGVPWKVIRLAAAKARELIHQTHPFATKIFRTDGRHILAEIARIEHQIRDRRLMDLISDQYEWEQLVSPYLVQEGVEFNEFDEPERWWPLGADRQVVVDPKRAFGAPIVSDQGVQTYVLAKAVAVEGSIREVADG